MQRWMIPSAFRSCGSPSRYSLKTDQAGCPSNSSSQPPLALVMRRGRPIGRQPWLVQGVMTTKEAVADVPAPMVLSTLIAYLAIYAILLAAYIYVIFYLARKASKGESIGTRIPPSPAAEPKAVPAE